MGQKGSLKDRIRFWKLQQRRKRKQKQIQEQEMWQKFIKEKKQQGVYIYPMTKKYNKIQQFFYIILGCFLGIFEGKKEDKKEDNFVQLVYEIDRLQEEIMQYKNRDMKVYAQKIERKEAQIEKIIQQKKNITLMEKKQLVACKKKIENMKVILNSELEIKPFDKPEKKDIPPKVDTPKVSNVVQEKPSEKEVLQEEPKLIKAGNNETSPFVAQREINSIVQKEMSIYVNVTQKEEKKRNYEKYIRDINQKIKCYRVQLKEMQDQVKRVESPQALYKIESTILWIQTQLYLMEKEYHIVAKDKDFQYLKNQAEYYQLDSNDLLENEYAIQALVFECKKMMEWVQALNRPVEVKEKKEPKEKKQREKKKEKKESFYLDIEDFKQLKKQISTDLKQQMREIQEIQTPFLKKRFFSGMCQFLSNAIFLFTPMVFFRNKLTGILTGTILMHNRLRSMQKLVGQNEAVYETGENLFQKIRNKQDCLEAIGMHLSVSLMELEQIKQRLIANYQIVYPEEVQMVLLQLDLLEQQIMERANSLQMDQNKLKQMQQEYQKILKK